MSPKCNPILMEELQTHVGMYMIQFGKVRFCDEKDLKVLCTLHQGD